ncbi:MAG TPA: outer membrane beta-barrel protein [Bryobacteraceae bacterium]
MWRDPVRRNSTRLAVATFLMPLALSGQDLSIGAMGGGALTAAAQNETVDNIRTWSQSKDWIVGATLELRFHEQLAVEVDALYRELHATKASVEADGSLSSVSPFRVETFEFPVLAKYRFGAGKLRLFAEAGPSFRAAGNLNFYPSHYGASAGVGVEMPWRRLNIAPALRYTRWAPDTSPLHSVSQLNQIELLVGVSRASESDSRPLGGRVSVGILAGWELSNDISPHTATPENTGAEANAIENVTGVKGGVCGPVLEVRLAHHLSVELDGIYRPLEEHVNTLLGNATVYSSVTFKRSATWQFPVLAKYRFRFGKVNPFAEAGPSLRLPVVGLSGKGATAGVGVEMHWRAVHIAPALRFTRWAAGTSPDFTRNEAAVLLGLSVGGPTPAAR